MDFLTPLITRSKLAELGSGQSLGLDAIYTQRRDICVDSLVAATLVKHRKIRKELTAKAAGDASFAEDFGALLLEVLAELPETASSRHDIMMVGTMIQTSKPSPNADATSVIAEALIRTALRYLDARVLAKLLEARQSFSYFQSPSYFDLSSNEKPKRGWVGVLHFISASAIASGLVVTLGRDYPGWAASLFVLALSLCEAVLWHEALWKPMALGSPPSPNNSSSVP